MLPDGGRCAMEINLSFILLKASWTCCSASVQVFSAQCTQMSAAGPPERKAWAAGHFQPKVSIAGIGATTADDFRRFEA